MTASDVTGSVPPATSLAARLEQYRAEERMVAWTGTFSEYFGVVVANPSASRLSHGRVYDMIMSAGFEEVAAPNEADRRRRYHFFDNEIFGIERALRQIVEGYFAPASQRLEVRKRILLLMGPVGGGKSSILTLLKRGMERYSRTVPGAVYAIKGCPMHEEPLHLIPEEMRPALKEEYGLHIEGDLCPPCRMMLQDRYQGRAEDVPIERIVLSEKNRVGIGTFSPSDPKSQDISELTGSIDLSTVGTYGSESDARAYRFDGELNVANRGIMEFIEMLKCRSGDTLVFTSGGIRRLDSLGAVDQIADRSVKSSTLLATMSGVETATHVYRAGVRPTKVITTQRGFVHNGAYPHRLLVVNEDGAQVWRRHDQIEVGDWIVSQKGQQLWGTDVVFGDIQTRKPWSCPLPERMSPELGRWLGYMVSEGDTQASGNIRFSNTEPELIEDYTRLTQSLFAVTPSAHPKGLHFGSVRVLDFLTHLGWKTGSYTQSVPWVVLQSSRACMLEFLAGYFAGDGSVGIHGRLSWGSASRDLVQQIQIVLLNLGVVSNVGADPRLVNGESRTYWKGGADGADADLLASQMRLLPTRKHEAYVLRATAQPRVGRTDIIPNVSAYWTAISDDLQQAVIQRAAAVGGGGYRTRTGASQILGSDYGNLHALRTGTNHCTRAKAVAILDKVEGHVQTPPGLAALLNKSQFYDRVVSVEDSEADCWDLHVPGSSTYVANGAINHNCDEKFLYNLLTLAQEQNIKTGRFAMIYADEVIISHTNETEYASFISNKRAEALHDRIIVVWVPYNLRVTDEIKIYEKLLRESNLGPVHLAPNTLRVVSTFAILSRLEPSKKASMSLMKKLKLYDGEEIEGFTHRDVRELQDEAEREGMDGISPRYVINALSGAVARDGAVCVSPITALRALKDGLEHAAGINKDRRTQLLDMIAQARQEYDELAKKEIQKAFVYSFEESAKTVLGNYLDNVEAFCNKTKMRDPMTDEEVEPDENLMRSIEDQIGVTETAKKTFREEILIRLSSVARRGETFTYETHDRLREAIEKKLFADLKDVVKITTSVKTPDAEQLRRINDVVDRLVQSEGYCITCANEIVRYVGTLMNR